VRKSNIVKIRKKWKFKVFFTELIGGKTGLMMTVLRKNKSIDPSPVSPVNVAYF